MDDEERESVQIPPLAAHACLELAQYGAKTTDFGVRAKSPYFKSDFQENSSHLLMQKVTK